MTRAGELKPLERPLASVLADFPSAPACFPLLGFISLLWLFCFCSPPKQSLSLLHVYPFSLLVNLCPVPLSRRRTTERLPQSSKTFCSPFIRIWGSLVSPSLFDQNLADVPGPGATRRISYQIVIPRATTKAFFPFSVTDVFVDTAPNCIASLCCQPHRASWGLMHYRGAHAAELERRVLHLAAVIGHVLLAILLFKSRLEAFRLDYSLIKDRTEKQTAWITTLKIIIPCPLAQSINFLSLPCNCSARMI